MHNRIDILRADMLNSPSLVDENVRNGKLANDFLPWDEKLNLTFGLKPFALLSTDINSLFKGNS
jgi:hypothetical protein